MLFGYSKYESIQDSTPYKHFLVEFCLKFLSNPDPAMMQFVSEALVLLGVHIDSTTMTFEEINVKLREVQESLTPKSVGSYIPTDEPVFLLRSKDPLGPPTVEEWIKAATRRAVGAERLKSAINQLAAMRMYNENSGFQDFK